MSFCYVVFDFETGGLSPQKNPVTEFAGVVVRADNYQEIAHDSFFVAPYGDLKYDEKALQVTGITMDQINSGLEITEAAKRIAALFDKAVIANKKTFDKKPILVAHNAAFDVAYLQQVFSYSKPKLKLESYLQGSKDFYGNFQPQFIDTVIDAKRRFSKADGDVTDHKLGTVCAAAGIDLVGAHRALADTRALKDFFAQSSTMMKSGAITTTGKKRETFQFNL